MYLYLPRTSCCVLQLKQETGSASAPQCWNNILEAEHTTYAERDVPMLNVTGKW